jgi:hypothetical protein
MQLPKRDDIVVIWTKIILYGVFLIVCATIFIFAPKKIIDDDFAFTIATSLAITDESNLLLYDYKVYATEERFINGLQTDVIETINAFHERNEIVAIKIRGEINKIEVKEDYIMIVDLDTPELNIEYYLVKDMRFDDINIPCRTFIMLVKELETTVNHIYLSIFGLILLLIMIPVTIKLTQNIVLLNIFKRENNIEIAKNRNHLENVKEKP